MRVAVVHDWLYVVGGAERVLREILACYPDADVFALFDVLTPEDRAKIGIRHTTTSFLQKMPFIATKHRAYLPLMPLAVEQLDLSGYDLVISSSYAVAKGVITGPNQVHIAYVHSPMRYAWDLQHTYLKESGYGAGLTGGFVRFVLHKMRLWDTRTANGPDTMIANSGFVARRIRKIYGRRARVIHPPVTLSQRAEWPARSNHFLVASRLVKYKNIDAVIEAFRLLPDCSLTVAGDGPEAARLRKLAGDNVTFAGFVTDEAMRDLMATARAFIFAAEEDFGIITVEAQAEGTPVLALGRGGSREIVVGSGPKPTGLFFDEPTPEAIAASVRRFATIEASFSRAACQANAERFGAHRFRQEFTALVSSYVDAAHLRSEETGDDDRPSENLAA